MKSSRKTEQSTEDIEGNILDKQEENRCIRRHNEDLKEQLKKSEDNKKSHVEVIKKFQNDNMQLENKLEKIQNEALKPQETKTQLPTHINAKKMALIKDNDIAKIPYRHPNHKNRYSKKWEMSKDSGTNVIKSPNDRSVWNANSPQQINLGWIDSSTYRKLCSTLSSSYRHVSSAMTPQKMMQKHYNALGTKPF